MIRFKTFLEARKNPEQNPKISAYEYLKKWKDDPDVYISFTDIDKLGINPQSKFNTPLAIYSYPLKEVWTQYSVDDAKSLTVLPFAAESAHIWVFKPKNKSTFINDMYKDYGSDKFDKDNEILRNIFISKFKSTPLPEIERNFIINQIEKYDKFMEVAEKNNKKDKIQEWKTKIQELQAKLKGKNVNQEWNELFNEAINTASIRNPIMSFWNLGRLLAIKLNDGKTGIKAITKWNWLLRQCGYSGFADKTGKGYIHPAEPIQAIFLTRQDLIVLGETYNKDFAGKQIMQINDMFDVVTMMKKVDTSYERQQIFKWIMEQDNFPDIEGYKLNETTYMIWKYATDKEPLKYLSDYAKNDKSGKWTKLLEEQIKYYKLEKYVKED